jgi:nodulation protein E
MSSRRVVVTGVGAICALGNNRESIWSALRAGTSVIGPMKRVDTTKLAFKNASEVQNFDPAAYFTPSQIDHLDEFSQFALVAAREAVRDSGIEFTDRLKQRSAIVTGVSLGGKATEDIGYVDIYSKGRTRVHPLTIVRSMGNAATSHISMEFGISGPSFTISTACSSSNHAFAQAFAMVRSGAADLALAGGAESPLSFGVLKAWESMRVVAPDTCRPFCKDRRGMILGEGAAILVLEPLEAALARGAHIYAEFAGAGMSADAHHITQPTLGGPTLAMRAALEDAGLAPEQVGYINAHGTGTPGNDPTETRAIREVFGAHANNLAVSSTKSMHGHALGAAGAIEAVATLLALDAGILPPTANFTEADPECDLDYVPNVARPANIEAALSNSFAFGGLNAVIALRAWKK